MTSETRSRRAARVALFLIVAVGLLGVWRSGALANFSEPRKVADALVAMGPWGYLAFIAAYAILQPFGVPGTAFIVAAPLIWPWRTAFVLSMTGTMAASVVGFSFARFLARDWVAARIPARLRKYEDSLERNAFQTVVVLRLLLWMPQMLHFFFGISKVRFWTHFWGSLVGYTPTLLVVSFFGSEMFDASGQFRATAWPVFAGLLVLSVFVTLATRRMGRRSASGPSAQRSES